MNRFPYFPVQLDSLLLLQIYTITLNASMVNVGSFTPDFFFLISEVLSAFLSCKLGTKIKKKDKQPNKLLHNPTMFSLLISDVITVACSYTLIQTLVYKHVHEHSLNLNSRSPCEGGSFLHHQVPVLFGRTVGSFSSEITQSSGKIS